MPGMPPGMGAGMPPGMPDMSALLNSLGPDGMPDFDKIAKASGLDAKEMKGHAERLWKHMDDLAAKSPEEYEQFLSKQAKNAGVDPSTFAGVGGGGAPGGGGVGGPGPGVGVGAGVGGGGGISIPGGRGPGAGARPSASDNRATFLMPMGQKGGAAEVAVVGVWRAATDLEELLPTPDTPASGPVKLRRRAPPRVEKVALPDPRKPEDDTSSASKPAGMPSLTAAGVNRNQPGLAPELEATIYDVEAHPDAVTRALDDPVFQSLLLESATSMVERENAGVKLDRAARRCYTHRADATPRTAAAAAAAAAQRGGLGGGMSSQLLTEIAGMSAGGGGGGSGGGKHGGAAAVAAAVVGKDRDGGGGGGGGVSMMKTKRPLIEEVKASHTVKVERGEGGVPAVVEVVVFLPALSSVADANLEVSERYLHLTPDASSSSEEMVIALPVPINPDAVSAKFKKKEKRLTLRLEPIP